MSRRVNAVLTRAQFEGARRTNYRAQSNSCLEHTSALFMAKARAFRTSNFIRVSNILCYRSMRRTLAVCGHWGGALIPDLSGEIGAQRVELLAPTSLL